MLSCEKLSNNETFAHATEMIYIQKIQKSNLQHKGFSTTKEFLFFAE
jgi:hypothetical protein